ncbi:MAG: AmmeMemoRadiSam system protein A [Limisphaerales bacterium]
MNDPVISVTDEEAQLLLRLARDSIEHGLRAGKPLPVEPAKYPASLRVPCGVFVTLEMRGDLRGCVGTLEAVQPLVGNVAKYAFAAAFSDSRFAPLTRAEFKPLELHISLLSELEAIPYRSEAELLDQIRPGIDGLLLEDETYRGTLLPSVWEDIGDKREFLRRLNGSSFISS